MKMPCSHRSDTSGWSGNSRDGSTCSPVAVRIGRYRSLITWTWKSLGGDPHYSAIPVFIWCASDGAGIACQSPLPPPPPAPSLDPSLPSQVGCLGFPGGFLSILFFVGFRGPYCCPAPLGPLFMSGLRLFGPGKFRCVASCPVPCRLRSHTTPT